MKWHSRFSLTTKALAMVLLIGFSTLISLDFYQRLQLEKLFTKELVSELEQKSEIAQTLFYNAVEQHAKVVRLFAQQENVSNFLAAPTANTTSKQNNGKPPWVPDISSWRGLILPSAMLLYDKNKNAVDSYLVRSDFSLPATYTHESSRWITQSLDRALLLKMDGRPVLVVSAAINHEIDGVTGFITLFVGIDEHFMYNKLAQVLPPDAAAVIFSSGFDEKMVLTSSDPVRFSVGTLAESLSDRYIFAGKDYFDQGDWGIQAQLSILLPKNSKDQLTISVLTLERQHRIIAALVFIALFTTLIVLLSYRIQGIARKIHQFARNELNIDLPKKMTADAVEKLTEYFDHLSAEIIESRQNMLKQHDYESRIGKLQILQSVTDDLRVGVLANEGGEWIALNEPMLSYIQQIGSTDKFITDTGKLDLIDQNCDRRIFNISHLETEDGKLVLVNEITELEIKTEQLTQMALHDSLTGLSNRVLFQDRLKQIILSAKRENSSFSILVMDLDRFKDVNDTLGHSVGDKLLSEVAYRFSRCIRSVDTLARIGGDEFAVLLPNAENKEARVIALKLVKAGHEPYQIDANIMGVGSSVGIVTYPADGESPDLLMSRADMAMYHAKRNQLGLAVYKSEIDSCDQDRLSLISDLRTAIQQNEILVHYQPQLNMKIKGRIHGWEALARWHHPQRGWVAPTDFILAAEETGIIKELTTVVLEQAIADCQLWQAEGQSGGVSINLSTYDLIDGHLALKVDQILAKHALAADQVTLEVTESALMQDPVTARHEMDKLNKLGVSLSVDDFGTGYSSLGYLKQLPVDEIKVDQVFIKNMVIDIDDEAIVRAVLSLAGNLKMSVVAEGVEDSVVLSRLGNLGCDITQGDFMSPPVPLNQVVGINMEHIDFDWLEEKQVIPRVRSN